MDAELLSRIQFAVTAGFHYIFPPITIGLGVILVVMEGVYLKTKNPLFNQMTRFWVKVFGLNFAIGVATGIVMEFEFGTNWANYSRFVGDIFGSALAAEGVFAFFLESGFLAVLLFGWDKVKPGFHFFSTIMVAFGAHFSAIWIIVANSWQQTPAGSHFVEAAGRMEITDFWQVVFNPSTLDRLSHAIMGAWQAGAWFVISVSAFYLIKKMHTEFAKKSIMIALVVTLVASLGQLITGHSSAETVAETQPAKLAMFEGQYESGPGDLYLFGWVNEEAEETSGLSLPGMTSWLVHGDASEPLAGITEAFETMSAEAAEKGIELDPVADRPSVNFVFQTYHLMVAIGMVLIALSIGSLVLSLMGKLHNFTLLLWVLVFSVLLPMIANQVGWIAAEVGRQPWIVYGEMLTRDGVSEVVSAGEVLTSLIGFVLIYLLLLALYIFLLDSKIKHGPSEKDLIVGGQNS